MDITQIHTSDLLPLLSADLKASRVWGPPGQPWPRAARCAAPPRWAVLVSPSSFPSPYPGPPAAEFRRGCGPSVAQGRVARCLYCLNLAGDPGPARLAAGSRPGALFDEAGWPVHLRFGFREPGSEQLWVLITAGAPDDPCPWVGRLSMLTDPEDLTVVALTTDGVIEVVRGGVIETSISLDRDPELCAAVRAACEARSLALVLPAIDRGIELLNRSTARLDRAPTSPPAGIDRIVRRICNEPRSASRRPAGPGPASSAEYLD